MATYAPQSLGIKPPSGGFKTGGWYNGRQYWNGTLSDPGVIHPESNQQGAGQAVNKEVVAASNAAQGLKPGTNEAYIASETAKAKALMNGGQNNNQPTTTPNPTYDTSGTPTPGASEVIATKPKIDVASVYNSAYKTPEIDEANVAISNAQAEIDAAQQAHDEALAIINDNPLYSAARMEGKQNKLDKKFANDYNRLLNAKKLAEDKLAGLKSDAEIKVNLALKQYDIDSQVYKDSVSQFNALLSAGALTNASGADLATYATQLGIPTSMLQSVVTAQKSKSTDPQVITATDDNGNMTATIIDKNTGKVINSTSLGQIDKSKSPSATESKQTYYNYAKADARSGVTLQQMLQIYGGYLSPNEIYATYNSNSSWGPAKDSVDVLKQYGINPNINAADALSALLGTGGQ